MCLVRVATARSQEEEEYCVVCTTNFVPMNSNLYSQRINPDQSPSGKLLIGENFR